MPEAASVQPAPAERSMDRQLVGSLFLIGSGALLEVVIGYTVAHWITVSASKAAGWVVSLCCLALVLTGGSMAYSALRRLGDADETLPDHGRRVFMARLALLACGFCMLVVIAGMLVLLTLRPND